MNHLFKFSIGLLLHAVLAGAGEILPGELCGENNTCVFDANRTSYELNFADYESCHTTYCCKANVTKLCTECDATGSCVRSDLVIQHWTQGQAFQSIFAWVLSMPLFMALPITKLFTWIWHTFQLDRVCGSCKRLKGNTEDTNVDTNDMFYNESPMSGTTSDSNTDSVSGQSSLVVATKVADSENDVIPVAEVSTTQVSTAEKDIEACVEIREANREFAERQYNAPDSVEMNRVGAIQEDSEGNHPRRNHPPDPGSYIADLAYLAIFLVCLVMYLAVYEIMVLPCASDDQQKVYVYGFPCYSFISASDGNHILALVLIPLIYVVGWSYISKNYNLSRGRICDAELDGGPNYT